MNIENRRNIIMYVYLTDTTMKLNSTDKSILFINKTKIIYCKATKL